MAETEFDTEDDLNAEEHTRRIASVSVHVQKTI